MATIKQLKDHDTNENIYPLTYINAVRDTNNNTVLELLDEKQDKLTFDTTPISGSNNPVTSGGVKTVLDKKMDVINLEEYCPTLLLELAPTMQSGTSVALSLTALAEYSSLTNIVGKYCIMPSIAGNEMFKLDRFDHSSGIEGKNHTYQSVTYFNDIYYGPYTDELETEFDIPELYSIMIVHTYLVSNDWQHTKNNDYRAILKNVKLLDKIELDTTPTANSTNPVTSGGIRTALDIKADKTELPLVVIYDGTQCDTSIADIYAAFLAGRNVEMNYGYLFKLSLVQCSEEGAIFSANFGDQSIGVKGTVSNGVDTWEFSLVDLQERLVSGTNIKTVAGNSLLGSGNVTLNDSDIYHSGEDGEDGNYIDDGDTVDVCLNNLDTAVANKQNTLVSGTNIKTVNGTSLLGSGDLAVVSVDAGDISVLQSTGDSQVNVMSQKAVTDEVRFSTIYDKSNMEWEMGSINSSTGVAENSDTYMRTKSIDVSTADEVETSFASGVTCIVAIYDKNGNKLYSAAWVRNGTIYTRIAYPTMAFIRLSSYPNNASTSVMGYFKLIIRGNIISVDERISPIEEYKEKKERNGSSSYDGFYVFENKGGAPVARSVRKYNLSTKPIIDFVCYSVLPSAGNKSVFFGFSPNTSTNGLYDSAPSYNDYIGFKHNIWNGIFIVRRNGTTLFSQDVGGMGYVGMIMGARIDFRRKTCVYMIKNSSTNAVTTINMDLSSYDLDLGEVWMYTALGFCSYTANMYVGWNSNTNLNDFSAFFNTSIKLGQFKKFDELPLLEESYDGRKLDGYFVSGTMSNLTNPTMVSEGHYSATLDSTTKIYIKTSWSSANLYGINVNYMFARFKIKPTGGDLEVTKAVYFTIKDLYDLTNNEEIIATNNVYTVPDGHETEVRGIMNINTGSFGILGVSGTCTLEMYDLELYGMMNNNLTPIHFDGKVINGGIPFDYPYPERLYATPLLGSTAYYAEGYMYYSSSKVYARVYDTSSNSYISKQISNN